MCICLHIQRLGQDILETGDKGPKARWRRARWPGIKVEPFHFMSFECCTKYEYTNSHSLICFGNVDICVPDFLKA